MAWAYLPGGAGQGQVVIDLSTGAQTRRRAPIEVMAVLDARLIGRCPELSGDLCSYDPAAGAFRWHTPVPAGIQRCPSLAWSSGAPSATATGGRIYALAEDHPDCVTADNQYLLVVDRRTGTLISALEVTKTVPCRRLSGSAPSSRGARVNRKRLASGEPGEDTPTSAEGSG